MTYLKIIFRVISYLILAIVALFVAFIILQEIVFRFWTQGGQLVTKPDVTILATAEYLYNNPISTPERIEELYVNQDEIVACVRTYGSVVSGDVLFTRWFLNGERVPFERYLFFRYWVPDYCVGLYGVLPGIHLLEIDINASPFYTAMSYQFAIKIEPTPTPSPTPSAP
jgi:hypothetical protein